MNEFINKVFVIRTLNEEQTDIIVTVGKHLATKRHFKSKIEAENYIKKPKWDMILALISEITTNLNKLDNEQTDETNR